MKPNTLGISAREDQIVELLFAGCENGEIAMELGISPTTVKAHFNRLYLRFGIVDGIKRVKLAVMLYRKRSACQTCMEPGNSASEMKPSSGSSTRD